MLPVPHLLSSSPLFISPSEDPLAPPRVATFSHADASEVTLAVDQLRCVGQVFWSRGWSVGTSSNYSVLLCRNPYQLLITGSGFHKGVLTRDQFVLVGEDGRPADPSLPHPSAETLLHTTLTQRVGVGAVLHTHSIWGTILSDHQAHRGEVVLEGYEMLKGLAGISTHQTRARVKIFENTQDMAALAQQVDQALDDPASPLEHAFLLRNHGLYTWGHDLQEALRHIEVLEFLLEVLGRKLSLQGESSSKDKSS